MKAAHGYRPEIDGLRAIAVTLVILFHARVAGVAGGFIGVDVFFVISGYLITRNILSQAERGEFRFKDFYVRRARRLGPALLVTILATLIAGWFILTPSHYQGLGKSALFAALSFSNFQFWAEAGYFDVSGELKPLLHTWSLGVEEQFYLIWPAALLALKAHTGRRLFLVIAVFGVISLVAAEMRFGLHAGEVFYLLPYRVSEFAVGALCIPASIMVARMPAVVSNALGLASLFVLLASAALLNESSHVPGVDAIAPSLSAACIIAGLSGRITQAILSAPPVVWIGRISYSLYLVHWPITVFYFYNAEHPPTVLDQLAIIGAAIIAGALLHYLVEVRFRYARKRDGALSRRHFAAAIISCIAGVSAVGGVVWSQQGWPGRLQGGIGEITASLADMKLRMFDRSAEFKDQPFTDDRLVNVVIIGDSHGANLFNALALAGAKAEIRHIHIQHSCQPYFGDRPFGPDLAIKTQAEAEKCSQQADALKSNSLLAAADYIFISSTWRKDGLQYFGEFLKTLSAEYKGEFMVVSPRFFFAEPEKILAEFSTFEDANRRFDQSKLAKKFDAEFAVLNAISAEADVRFIDLTPFICDTSGATAFCPLFSAKNEILYFDWHHWTPAGEAQVGEGLRRSGVLSDLF